MKKIFTLFAAVLLAGSMMAENASVVQIGSLTNASTNTKFPWYSAYECSSSEIVYTSDDLAELPANSTLTKLEFAVIGGQLIYTHLRVWLENTDDVTVVATSYPGTIKSTADMTKVYDTTGKGYPLDDREVNGYYEATTENPGYLDFAFDTPFTYTGGGLRIRFEVTGSNWCASAFEFVVDADKASENENMNCSVQYDFTEEGLRERPAGAERSFPIIKISYTAPEATTVTLAANKNPEEDAYYATYFHSTADYQVDANTTIYQAILSADNTTLSLDAAQEDIIPAGTAVILKSTSNEIELTPVTDPVTTTDYTENVLKGVDAATAVSTLGAGTIYTLAAEGNIMAFYKFVGTSIPANKAYLQLAAGQSAPHRIAFGTTITTAMENTTADVKAEKVLRNGQLLIKKGDVLYNAQGAIVK